jgi:hypothetical protein
MYSLWSFTTLLSVATALVVREHEPQHIFSNPPTENSYPRMPSIHESTVMARRILQLSSEGTLVTVFPDDSATNTADDADLGILENRPPGMGGSPIGLMEYYADCENNGNPTLLGIDIATPFRNYKAGSNISLAIRWWPTQTHIYSSFDDDDDFIPTPHTPAALPRFSLHGHLEPIDTEDIRNIAVPVCFLAKHPDAAIWQPGNDIHNSEYMRLVVEHVYWFGGFGDRSRIGWLPMDEWRNVTSEEIDEMRLPGEKKSNGRSKGWREWL